MISAIFTNDGVSFFFDGKQFTIAGSDFRFKRVKEAIRKNDSRSLKRALKSQLPIPGFKVRITKGNVFVNGKALAGPFVDMVIRLIDEGFDTKPFAKFLTKMGQNKRPHVRAELADFVFARKIALTPEGDMVLYKRVNERFKDFRTGKFDNSVGSVCREENVDENRDNECSSGLHVCGFDYLPHFNAGSGKVIAVLVNPKDVVAVPRDCRNAKMRVMEYKVLAETSDKEDPLGKTPLYM